MADATYLLLELGTLGAAIGMGVYWRQEWLRRWQRTLAALALAILPFMVWDVIVTQVGHWGFNARYTLGPELFGLPFEEYLFFVVVGLASVAVWQRMYERSKDAVRRRWLAVPAVFALVVGVWGMGRGYTLAACALVLLTCLLLACTTTGRALLTRRWAWYQLILIALFFVFNSVATGLPIVTYGAEHIIGFRIGTIPIEDLLYNFGLVNIVVLAHTKITAQKPER